MSERPVVALMHGHGATRKNLWIPSVADQFPEAEYEVIALRLPNRGMISLEQSISKVQEAIGGKRVTLAAAHSCHARTLLHYAETHNNIDRLVVVAGFLEIIPDDNADPKLQDWKTFYSRNLDFEAIVRNTRRRLGLYSTDDHWLINPNRQADIFEARLGSVLRFEDEGHFEGKHLPVNLAGYLKQL
jgi:predicted alpha/beta hydrolase family esterase